MRVSFSVYSFKKADNPYDDKGSGKKPGKCAYDAVMPVESLPQVIWDWHQGVNPREISTAKPAYKAMVATLKNAPETFFARSRGIALLAEAAEFDNRTNVMTLTFKDPDIHGLLDGGHNAAAIHAVMKEQNGKVGAFVKVAVMTGYTDKDETLEIVEARNTSTQVQNKSILNQKGAFQVIKDALAKEDYAGRIAYKENETTDLGDKCDIPVEDVIAALACFDTAYFDSETHPTMAYNGRAKLLNYFVAHNEDMKKVCAYIAPDILVLRDVIFKTIPMSFPRGKSVASLDSCYEGVEFDLPFLGETSEYEISGAYVYPFLAALRQLTAKGHGGNLVWAQEPVAFTEKHLKGYVKEVMRMMNEDELFPNANKMGKNRAIYKFAYMYVAEKLR